MNSFWVMMVPFFLQRLLSLFQQYQLVFGFQPLTFLMLFYFSGQLYAEPLTDHAFALKPAHQNSSMQLSARVPKKHLHLGIYLHQDRAVLMERYQPFIAYLKQALPDYQLEWGLYSPSEFKEALQKHELDVLFTNPSLYQLIRFENSLGAPIATAKRIHSGAVISSLGGHHFYLGIATAD